MDTRSKEYRTVADLMHTDVLTIEPEAPIAELARILRHNQISAVPVVDPSGRPIGVASASDLLWICEGLLNPAASLDPVPRTVRDVMTPDVFSVQPSGSLHALCRFFDRTGVHRAPVVEDGRIVGIVSLTDLLGVIADRGAGT